MIVGEKCAQTFNLSSQNKMLTDDEKYTHHGTHIKYSSQNKIWNNRLKSHLNKWHDHFTVNTADTKVKTFAEKEENRSWNYTMKPESTGQKYSIKWLRATF